MDVTAQIAEFVAGTPFDALPSDAVTTARRMLVDVVGVALAGAADPKFAPIAAFGARHGGHGIVPGPNGRRYDVSSAALLTGAAAHLLDYDDVQTAMGGHPSVTLLPVISALGYSEQASGADVLRAIVLGTEVDVRLGRGMNPAHYGVGWHPTSVLGCIGAAVAASCLLDLDAEATCRAIGIAASAAGGSKANFGSNVKSLHAGLTGRAGVEAGLLASLGASANERMLDTQFGGFFDLYTPQVNVDAVVSGLGATFQIIEAGVSFKLLPCCGSTHSATWAAIALHDTHALPADRIGEIRIHLDPRRIAHTDRTDVRTGLHAKFSAQYCAAVGALQGALSLRDFDDAVVLEPIRQSLLRRVRLIPSTDLHTRGPVETSSTGSRSTYVEIEDVEGNVVAHFQPGPRGYASLPPSDADIAAKFGDCLAVAGARRVPTKELLRALNDVEKTDNVRALFADVWNVPEEHPS